MKKILFAFAILIIIIGLGTIIYFQLIRVKKNVIVNSFEECVAAGNPVTQNYPRQCRFGDKLYTEYITDGNEKDDLIRVSSLRPYQIVNSPLVITGVAKGSWFFEASFPIVLISGDGTIVAQGIAKAKSDWMTTNFVQYEATLTFKLDKNLYNKKAMLVFKKDNPSGLPENENSLEIPVIIGG